MKTQFTTDTGFKVCYKEQNSKKYVLHWLAHDYKSAVYMLNYYKRYPQHSRDDYHLLKKPKWKIFRITIKEVEDGIWRQDPF